MNPTLSIRDAALSFGERALWRGLQLDVEPGEFVAVLGGNGTGKTTLLRAILGLQQLDAGTIALKGRPVHRGDRRIGYVPQQKLVAPSTPLRGRDLVAFGVDGHRFGLPFVSRGTRAKVDELVAAVGATDYAQRRLGTLSGGEQQRLRVAQALAADPVLLLCDEPLASLDLQQQRAIASLIDSSRRERATAVLFVTHDINPVLGLVDRILYLAAGEFRTGTPDEVLRSDVLSALYGSPVEVLRSGGRVLVAGIPDAGDHVHHVREACA